MKKSFLVALVVLCGVSFGFGEDSLLKSSNSAYRKCIDNCGKTCVEDKVEQGIDYTREEIGECLEKCFDACDEL